MERASIPLRTKLRYVEELCSGLHYAHRNGVVHRDVKPDNIMVDDEGLVKILDFGIAHFVGSTMTQSGVLMGTPSYMAPEQVQGRAIDERTDVFAVGAVLYELLAYQRAFAGELATVLHRIVYEYPEPLARVLPTLDRRIVRIVERALAKDPAQRYTDPRAMAADIGAARQRLDPAHEPTIQIDRDTTATARRGPIRWRYGAALAALGVVALLMGVQPSRDAIGRLLRPSTGRQAPRRSPARAPRHLGDRTRRVV